jgi:hypothetical protein
MGVMAATDMCATAALIAGTTAGTLPAALAVGYVFATFGWLGFALMFCMNPGEHLGVMLRK